MTDSSAKRDQILQRWREADDFTKLIEDRDIAKDGTARQIVNQIASVRTLFPKRHTRLVEIGAGDGKLLNLLAKGGRFERYVGSDIANPRLDQARVDFPHLELIEADLVKIGELFMDDRTHFVAMNVLGNIVEDELEHFFQKLSKSTSVLTFSARDVSPDYAGRAIEMGVGYAYNFRRLIVENDLAFLSSRHGYDHNWLGRGGIIATVISRNLLRTMATDRGKHDRW